MNKRLAAAFTCIFVLGALLVAASALASSASALFNRGNELYQAGTFKDAAAAYRDAIKTGLQNPDLYYNLGNAELRDGRLGPAIAAYLRAERLAPRDPDIRFNLAYARGQLKTKLPDNRDPLNRALDAAVGLVSANEALAVLAGLYWFAAAAAVGLVLGRGPRLCRACRNLIYAAAFAAVLFLPVAGTRIKRDLMIERAVMASAQVARSGPGEANTKLFDLPEGAELTIGQCQSGWCQISTRGGINGWVEARGFERL